MTRRLGISGFLGTVGVVFVLAFAGTLLLPHDPYIRYQSFNGTIFGRLGWIYERLNFSKTPIDVLVVDSSRGARGANAAAIEVDLAQSGHPAHVANISIPAAGLDIRLTKIRDALKNHKIKLLIFGLSEALPRDGHQTFGKLGSVSDILTAPWIINRNLPTNIAALPYREIELAVATAIPEAFGYRRVFDPAHYSGETPDHRRFDDPNWSAAAEHADTPAHAEELAADSKRRRAELNLPILPESLGWIEYGVSRYYVRQVAQLAEENGVKMVFLFLPFYQGYDMPVDAAWVEQFGPIWTPDFLKSDPRNYADAAHVSQRGMELLTPWLSGLIEMQLESAP